MKSQLIQQVLLIALFVCYFDQIKADVVTYKNHYLYSPRPEYLIIPKYAKKDAPNWSPGNGRSFIDLSRFNFDLDCDKTHFTTGTIPDYLLSNGNLGLALRSFSVLRLDLSVENIMGTTYYHAGPGQADATFNLAGGVRDAAFINQQVPYMSQRGRFIRFRLTYSLFGQGK